MRLNLFASCCSGRTATVEQTLDAAVAAPTFDSVRIEKRSTAGQNGPQIRPVVHRDGTVYAVFYGWRSVDITNRVTADVVVVRDDNRKAGAYPYTDLVDNSDGIAGVRVIQGITFTIFSELGQQRLIGNPSIAVDPRNSSTVYLAWADEQTSVSTLQLYLGDYICPMAVGRTFYGIFSASNSPNRANFPNGVRYQRNVDFANNRLLSIDRSTPVASSIDAFFVKSS